MGVGLLALLTAAQKGPLPFLELELGPRGQRSPHEWKLYTTHQPLQPTGLCKELGMSWELMYRSSPLHPELLCSQSLSVLKMDQAGAMPSVECH